MHLEILVEETSAEVALRFLIPKVVNDVTFRIHTHRGKRDLIKSLPSRLRSYQRWHEQDFGVVVVVDEDRQNCHELKARLEELVRTAGLVTKASARAGRFQAVTRIAVEELEAWFLGDADALTAAYPRVPRTFAQRAAYRVPDEVTGGTWEALERLLQRAGYYRSGLAKIQAARDIAQYMEPSRNRSKSFRVFCDGLRALVAR